MFAQLSLRVQFTSLLTAGRMVSKLLLHLASIALVSNTDAVPASPLSDDQLTCVNCSVDGYDASPPPVPAAVLECIEHVQEVHFVRTL